MISLLKNFICLTLFTFPFFISVNSQKLNIGVVIGVLDIAKIETQYNINDQMALGVFYKFGYQYLSPTFFGFSLKRNIKNQDIFYYGLNLGLQYIRNSEISVIENPTAKIGGGLLFGVQKFGVFRRVSLYQEGQIGYMPNNLFSLLWKGFGAIPYPFTGQSIIKDFTYSTWWNISFGIRFHLGKQNF
jgi:hypothetical protein